MSQFYEMPLFPLSTVLFPGMILPLHIFEDRYKLMVSRCLDFNEPFGVVLIQEGQEVGRANTTIFDIGTTAHITHIDRMGDGQMNIATVGMRRFRIHSIDTQKEPYLVALVEDFPFQEDNPYQIAEQTRRITPLLTRYLDILAQFSEAEIKIGQLPDDAATLACLAAIVLQTPMEDKQSLLSIPALADILEAEKNLLIQESHVLKLLTLSAPKWRNDEMPFSPN